MRLRHLLLSQWVFAVEKPIGRIVKRFFVVGEHSSVTRKGIVANKKKSIREAPRRSPALYSFCGALWYTFGLTDVAVSFAIGR
jgi:hypothetical protein